VVGGGGRRLQGWLGVTKQPHTGSKRPVEGPGLRVDGPEPETKEEQTSAYGHRLQSWID
jgi:hypothetical protein